MKKPTYFGTLWEIITVSSRVVYTALITIIFGFVLIPLAALNEYKKRIKLYNTLVSRAEEGKK